MQLIICRIASRRDVVLAVIKQVVVGISLHVLQHVDVRAAIVYTRVQALVAHVQGRLARDQRHTLIVVGQSRLIDVQGHIVGIVAVFLCKAVHAVT